MLEKPQADTSKSVFSTKDCLNGFHHLMLVHLQINSLAVEPEGLTKSTEQSP
jgi:hypothetical protein